MSNPLHVLLKADPHFDGDVAEGKTYPSASHQVGQVSSLRYFLGAASSMDHQHLFRQAGLQTLPSFHAMTSHRLI